MSEFLMIYKSKWVSIYGWFNFLKNHYDTILVLVNGQVPHSRTDGLKQREQLSDDIIIYDITDDIGDEEKPPVTPESSEDAASDSK